MSGKRSVTKNYIYNMAYQILTLITPLITTPYVSRVLGATQIGKYSYTQSIVMYFILVGTIGISMYGQREIAYIQDEVEKRTKVFFEINILRAVTVTLALAVFVYACVFNGKYKLLYAIQVIDIVANMFDISWFFQGIEDFKRTVIRNMFVKLLCVTMIFVFVKKQEDLPLYVLCYSLSLILGNISLWFYIPKYIVKVKLDSKGVLSHLKPSIMLFIPQVAVQVYTVLDRTMLGKLAKESAMQQVGYYEQSQKIVKLLITIITALGTVMLPRMANVYAKKDTKLLNEYMDKSFKYTYMLGIPLMLGLISVSKNFVPIFYGPGYEMVGTILICISPIIIFIGLSNVVGAQYQIPTNKQFDYTLSVVAGAVVNFLMNLILIPRIGVMGAVLATVVAEFVVLFVHFYCVRKDLSVAKSITCCYKYLIAGIIMFVGAFGVGFTPIDNNLIKVVLQVITGVILYFVPLLLMKEELLAMVIGKVLKK